jgi:hypothetical protein
MVGDHERHVGRTQDTATLQPAISEQHALGASEPEHGRGCVIGVF